MIFLVQSQIALATARIVQILSAEVNKDAWISVLVSGLIIQFVAILLWLLLKRYPTSTWYSLLSSTLGSFFGKTLSLLYAAFFIYLATLEVLSAAELLQYWMLTFTPKFITIILVTLAAVLLARENISAIIRFYSFTIFFIFLFPILATVTYSNFDLRNILPIGSSGTSAILNASYESFCSLAGFIAIIMLYSETEGSSAQKLRTMLISNICSICFFTFLIFSASAVLGPELLKAAKFHLTFMVRDVTLGLIQRIDLYYVLIGLVFKIISCITFLYLSASGVGHVFHKNQHRKAVHYLGFIVVLLAISSLFDGKMINNFVITIFVAIIPSLLLLFTYLFQNKKKKV
ncbi:GerAB/ArcD/ProY family transporter [Chengkuizengella axinellae]|uniref:GerAB/ArcD/ProY family transporter n=1 Tax=Chengkuizengella axinellae TaxID=3064388 RepID=UPI00352782F9